MGRFLIIGGDSTLGAAVGSALKAQGHVVNATSRRPGSEMHLDLSADLSDWTAPTGYDVCFLFAGVTSIDACEKDPAGTRRINVENNLLLAREILKTGCRVVYPSASIVFDGTRPLPKPSDPLTPIAEYGRQRAAVEMGLSKLGGRTQIIRYSKVLTHGMPLFSQWRKELANGNIIRPIRDMYFAPVSLDFAVEATVAVVVRGREGVWHISGMEDVSYGDAGRIIADNLGVSSDLVQEIPIEESGAAVVVQPRFVAMDSLSLGELGLEVPSVGDAIIRASLHV